MTVFFKDDHWLHFYIETNLESYPPFQFGTPRFSSSPGQSSVSVPSPPFIRTTGVITGVCFSGSSMNEAMFLR